jgi:hypothetical protein
VDDSGRGKKVCLNVDQLRDLKKSLMFLYVHELRDMAIYYSLADKGNKMALIKRILHFLQTGEKLVELKFPKESCAKRGMDYPLTEDTLMLKGV